MPEVFLERSDWVQTMSEPEVQAPEQEARSVVFDGAFRFVGGRALGTIEVFHTRLNIVQSTLAL